MSTDLKDYVYNEEEHQQPQGSMEITRNGNYNVSRVVTANVNIEGGTTPNLQTKEITITENGTQEILPDENYDGLESVNIITNVSGGAEYYDKVTLSDTYNPAVLSIIKTVPALSLTSNITTLYEAFKNCKHLKSIPSISNCSQITNFSYMFDGCTSLVSAPEMDTSNGTSFQRMFMDCNQVATIPRYDFSSAVSLSGAFNNIGMVNIGGFKDLGKAYLTTANANYNNYTLSIGSATSSIYKVTHDSLMNIINDLYDIASKGCKTQKLQIYSDGKALLTEEEIAIATEKGWTVS